MTIEETKLTLQQTQMTEEISPEEDRKLRMLAKLLVDKLFEDIHSGKVGNNG